jgi:hypothetical protein
MRSSMAPRALSHGDGALGDGVEDCITSARRLWRAELGSSPRRPPRRRAQVFYSDCGGLSVGLMASAPMPQPRLTLLYLRPRWIHLPCHHIPYVLQQERYFFYVT